MELGVLDLVVCLVALIASALIGVYFAFRSKGGADEYLRGSKTLSIYPVSLSLVASFISGVTLLGLPSEIYRYGTQFLVNLIAKVFVGITIAYLLLPLYHNLKLESCYQYLELRFDKRVRKMASILYVISQMLFIPIVIYVPALALSQVTGAQLHSTTLLTSLVCIFYTTFGGIKAVVWTDALQTVLLLGAQITVAVLGVVSVGGLSKVWQINEEGGRLQFFDMDPNPMRRHSFWTCLLGSYTMHVAVCGVGQGYVQRYLAVPSLRSAQIMMILFVSGLIFVAAISGFLGLVAYAAYHDCDPLASGRMTRPDQLVPVFLLDVAGDVPGLTGLYVAGVLSAALSSMSTGINAVCGCLIEDIFPGKLPKCWSQAVWLRITAACVGLICLALVLVVEHLGGVLQATISMSGVSFGAIMGLFLLGMFCPRANAKAALAGSMFSLICTGTLVAATQAAIYRGELKHKPLPVSTAGCTNATLLLSTNATESSIVEEEEETVFPLLKFSYLYYCALGTFMTLVVALPMALLVPKDSVTLPPAEYLHHSVHKYLPSKTLPQREAVPLVSLKN